LNPNDNT